MSFNKVGSEIWRDYVTDGVPASGAHNVAKPDMRAWMLEVESASSIIRLRDTDDSHNLTVSAGSNLSVDRSLVITTGDNSRTIDISAANLTLSAFGATLIDDANSANARATLGVVIGTDVIGNVVEDITPQLGGALDANAFSIGFDDNTGITDDAGNEQLWFQKTTSAVDYWEITNAVTGGRPLLQSVGDDTNVIGQISGKGTGGIEIKGTGTNDNATSGYVGQYIESVVLSGSAVSLTSGATANVTSISLPAGDWNVTGIVSYTTASTTSVTGRTSSISNTSATNDLSPGRFVREFHAGTVPTAITGAMSGPIPVARISLAATTTIYLVATASFTVSTLTAYGILQARRVR
jgi:hypothetical protein